MTDAILRWEPDVEHYKLEHFTHLGVIPDGAYKISYPRKSLESRGTQTGELYGELRGIREIKTDALKTLVWNIVHDGKNPLDYTFHINRTFIDGVEHLVFWVL